MYETQLGELREKLCKTELQLSDAQETSHNLREIETTMKSRVEKLQRELDSTKLDSKRNVTSLQVITWFYFPLSVVRLTARESYFSGLLSREAGVCTFHGLRVGSMPPFSTKGGGGHCLHSLPGQVIVSLPGGKGSCSPN